jgi:hypothetical protein
MTNIDDLKKEELENLQENELFDLESLILEGAEARIPVVFEYPRKDGSMVEVTCKLKPLTNVEVDNARRVAMKVSGTTMDIELLKRGMFTKNGAPFPPHLIEKMATGVVTSLSEKLGEISGIQVDEEEKIKFAEKMMGF